MIVLRDYQRGARHEISEHIRAGRRRIMLCMPTGSGKTETAMSFVEGATEKDRRSLYLTDRVPLARQASKRFWNAGIMHGMIQGADNTQRRWELAQIAVVQTIETRGFWPSADLVLIDEAQRRRQKVREFIHRTKAVVLGLSATPFADGLGEDYEVVVNATTTRELMADRWLQPFKAYNAVKQIDMRGARTRRDGEWADRTVAARGWELIGDIVGEWIEKTHLHFGGPVPTMLFGPTVQFCEEICASFQAAGYDFRAGSYRDDGDQTEALLQGFQAGQFTGLACVDKFATGVDLPDVLCLVFARPYRKSFTAHIQALGRLMRPTEGYEYGLLLDFAGNYLGWRHDMRDFFDHGCPRLSNKTADFYRKRVEPEADAEKPERVCHACGFVVEEFVDHCPACGAEWRRARNTIATVPGRLEPVAGVAVQSGPAPAPEPDRPRPGAWKEDRPWTWKQIVRFACGRFPDDDERARKFARVQFKNLYGEWPGFRFDRDDSLPDPRVDQAIMHRLKKYWRATKERAA